MKSEDRLLAMLDSIEGGEGADEDGIQKKRPQKSRVQKTPKISWWTREEGFTRKKWLYFAWQGCSYRVENAKRIENGKWRQILSFCFQLRHFPLLLPRPLAKSRK